ncbi:hypothetical protein Tco_0352414 [Tanacetum coccineum]
MSVKRSYANLKDYDLRDVEIDDSTNTYGPQKTQPSESESQTTEFDTCDSNISTESSELVSEPIVNESNVEVQPKVWSDAPIIGGGERKPTWNNVQRINKQNQFVPLAVQTRTGNNPFNTAKASINTVKPIVNGVRPANVFHKTHSPSSRPFKRTTVLRTNFSNQKVYTAKVKEVSTVGGKWDTAVKSSAGNKAYMLTFMLYWAATVAFGGSKGYITGKGKIKTGKLDFEDVSFVKELQHFNLFSVSQMCDKKNKVLFTDTEWDQVGNMDSTICIIENPVQHSKTKHIEIRHHFIRDCNAKKLIQMAKIDSEHNVADLLTKGFDAGRFQYLVSSIGMLNP